MRSLKNFELNSISGASFTLDQDGSGNLIGISVITHHSFMPGKCTFATIFGVEDLVLYSDCAKTKNGTLVFSGAGQFNHDGCTINAKTINYGLQYTFSSPALQNL